MPLDVECINILYTLNGARWYLSRLRSFAPRHYLVSDIFDFMSDIFDFMSDTFMFMSFTSLSPSAIDVDSLYKSAIYTDPWVQMLSIPTHLILDQSAIDTNPLVLDGISYGVQGQNCNGTTVLPIGFTMRSSRLLVALNSDTFMFVSTLWVLLVSRRQGSSIFHVLSVHVTGDILFYLLLWQFS